MPTLSPLLQSLPSKTSRILRAECELVELERGEVLSEPGDRIRDVYFPVNCVISLLVKASEVDSLEVALVGDEGMIGLPLLLGADTKPFHVVVQRSGPALHLKAGIFMRMTNTSPPLRSALNRYANSRLSQIAQNAICASAHQLDARLARRLLEMHDKSHSDHFEATHDELARSLGVRRSGVTCVAVTLQQQALIHYQRGKISILNRRGLEDLSCNCSWPATKQQHSSANNI